MNTAENIRIANGTNKHCTDGRCYVASKHKNAQVLHDLNLKNLKLIESIRLRLPQLTLLEKRYAKNLILRYNANVLAENLSPSLDSTSYVLDKGKEIRYCIPDKYSQVLWFVNLHEISHLCEINEDDSHPKEFWTGFRFVLNEAIIAGMPATVDYSKTPEDYCGITVDHNPLYA